MSEPSDMTRDDMSMEVARGITEDNSSKNTVTDITPTNSTILCELNSTTHTDSDIDHNISVRDTTAKETSSFELNQTLEIDVDTVSKETNTRTRSKKQSKGSNAKKDKCPCLTSDTKSWKPKCSNCNQTWHTACCNLLGITSIIELENWQCPWCYETLFADPSKPKTVMNTLKEIHIDVNSIQNKCDNFSTLDLRKQISDLEEIVNKFKTPSDPESINKIHDDILKSINFELQKNLSNQNSASARELAQLKASIKSVKPISTVQADPNPMQNVPKFSGKHYDHHQTSFLQAECRNSLESFVSEHDEDFIGVGNRKVMYFGEFSYRYSSIEHKEAPMPDVVQGVIDQIHDKFPNSARINSCLVTKYASGLSSCPAHGDNEPFITPDSDIFTISIGSERTMKFENCNDQARKVNESIKLKDNELLVFSRVSQDFYHHSIVPEESTTQTRYSFTFRCLAPYNLNYTTIIGDSNTKDIEFGVGKGKLGLWMPGARIKSSKIKNIPDPQTVGPCRNILINVGINDVQGDNPKSAEYLAAQYKTKIEAFLDVYPKVRIFISLLLPTKDSSLNFRVNELNACLKKLAANCGNVSIIEHHNLLDNNGFLNPVLGRYKRGLPSLDDHIHLGINGLKRFVNNIKSRILYKKSSVGLTQPVAAPPQEEPSHPFLPSLHLGLV